MFLCSIRINKASVWFKNPEGYRHGIMYLHFKWVLQHSPWMNVSSDHCNRMKYGLVIYVGLQLTLLYQRKVNPSLMPM